MKSAEVKDWKGNCRSHSMDFTSRKASFASCKDLIFCFFCFASYAVNEHDIQVVQFHPSQGALHILLGLGV